MRRAVEARVLGEFALVVDGRPLTRADWQRISAEQLIKLLLITPGHRLSREVAAETLWPDAGPGLGRADLRKAVFFARRALGPDDLLRTDPRWLELDGSRLDLDLDRLVDALDVLGAGGSAESIEPAEGLDPAPSPLSEREAAALDQAVRLGSRRLLPDDAYDDWLAGPRERLQSRWQHLALVAARRAVALGRRGEAHELLDRALERDDTDEAAHRLAIQLYASEGRHHAARRQFQLCRAALREGLDLEPSPETVAAFRAAEHAASGSGGSSTAIRLVARRAELERIEPLLDRVEVGRSAALAIHGPAGVGKTRLLQEVVADARAAGWQVIEWQAVEATATLAYAPLRIGLADLVAPADADTWPEPARSGLASVAPGVVRPGLVFADRTALVAALVAAVGQVARRAPLLLAVDDVGWLDPASLEVLRATVAAVADGPILVVTTNRDDEPVPDAITGFVEQARRSGGLDLALGPLAQRDLEPLVLAHLGGEAVGQALVRRAFEVSRGNPLFCLELFRAAREHGVIALQGGRWLPVPGADLGEELPDTALRLVAARMREMPAATLDLLAVTAELGPVASFEALSGVDARSDREVLASLDRALEAALLVERDTGYAFAHPLYRQAVRQLMGGSRRGEACLAIARALAGPAGQSTDAGILESAALASVDPVPVAEHALEAAELGVSEALPLAVAFGFAAGERSKRLLDGDTAQRLLERSLDAWRRLPGEAGEGFAASRAAVSLAELRMGAGDDEAATSAYRVAIAAARSPDELAEAYALFEEVPYRHGDFDGALAIVEEGLARLPVEAVTAAARLHAEAGWDLVRLRRFDDARPLLEGSLRVLEDAGDRAGMMKALDRLGMLDRYVGRSDDAIRHLERSLALALELGDPRGEVLARMHFAVALTRTGQPARARPHYARGLEMVSLMGDRYDEAVTSWGAAEMEDALGDYAAAAELRHRELRLLASIGGNPHNEAMSHAHLAHLARLTGDETGAAREAATARRLAERSGDPGYPARVEEALAVERWSQLET